jgi:hypothetical protein
MADKKKNEQITTPRGRAIYPHLNTPDTKFSEGGPGNYHTKLAVPTNLVEELTKKIDKVAAEALADAIAKHKADPKKAKKAPPQEASLPYELNTENEDETVFKFKMNSEFKKGEETVKIKPALFDAALKPLSADKKIGGGSVLRVTAELVPYFMASTNQAGVSLRLKAVQVIELRSFGQSAEDYGFEAEEGFTAEETGAESFQAEESTEASGESTSGTDASDF